MWSECWAIFGLMKFTVLSSGRVVDSVSMMWHGILWLLIFTEIGSMYLIFWRLANWIELSAPARRACYHVVLLPASPAVV